MGHSVLSSEDEQLPAEALDPKLATARDVGAFRNARPSVTASAHCGGTRRAGRAPLGAFSGLLRRHVRSPISNSGSSGPVAPGGPDDVLDLLHSRGLVVAGGDAAEIPFNVVSRSLSLTGGISSDNTVLYSLVV